MSELEEPRLVMPDEPEPALAPLHDEDQPADEEPVSLLDAALRYAAEGRSVFPLHELREGECSCGDASCDSPGKHPRTRSGLHDASADPATVAEWWRRWPNANIGLPVRPGEVVLDIDPRHDGGAALHELLDRLRVELPATREATTGNGGRHLWFALPEGVELGNSAARIGAGIDTRGVGGYVVAPPSRTTGDYRWTSTGPLAEAPAWLLEMLRKPEPSPRQALPPPLPLKSGGSAYGLAALAAEAAALRSTPEGGRNHRLNEAAFALGQLVAGGELDEALTRERLREAALMAGLGERETDRTLASGLGGGIAEPRTAPLTAHKPRAVVPLEPVAETDATSDEAALLPFRPLQAFIDDRPAMPELPLIGAPERAFMPRAALVVLGGIGGSTKTTLATDGIAHWASGTPWSGFPLERPLRVGIVDVEGPREPMRQKLEHKVDVWPGAPFADNVFILDGPDWGRFSFADSDDRLRLRNSCRELTLDLVVCNPVGRLGMRGGGTPEEVGEFVGWLRECGCWTTTAFLLLHHLNRGLHRELLLRLSGAWDRDADTIILLAREGQRKTKLTWAKLRWARDGGPEDESEILEWDVPTLGFRRLVAPEKHTETLEETRARVRAYLAEHADDWHATNAVIKSVPGTDKLKREALFDLFETGEIALSVGGPGKPVQPVGEGVAADYRRPKVSKYWKALNHAPSQSAIPWPPTAADTTPATPEEDRVGESATPRRGESDSAADCTGFDSEPLAEPEEAP